MSLKIKLPILAILLLNFQFGSAYAQEEKLTSEDSTAFKAVISQLSFSKKLEQGTHQLVLPKPTAGYQLFLYGSSRKPVINTDGKVYQPLTDSEVQLVFKLKNTQNNRSYEFPQTLQVVGQFRPETGVNKQPFVIPALQEWKGGNGYFKLLKTSRIIVSATAKKVLQPAAEIFLKDLKLVTGFNNLTISNGKARPGDIILSLTPTQQNLGNEGYAINIDQTVHIKAPYYKGTFWATRTILQLLEQDPLHRQIVKGTTHDYPKYEVRGFVLDVGRKFFTLNFLKHYVKMMAYYKMGDFHIHLNDNGFKQFFDGDWNKTYSAFRLESTVYPQLTAKDGHYTKAEFKELQQTAKLYGMRIIPEIDVPAHSLAFTKAFPEIGSIVYGMDHLDINNPKTYEVIENVFKEYIGGKDPVFVDPEVHIGTDEYAKKEAESFRAFTDHYIRFVQSFGKKVRLWGALTHAQGQTPVSAEGVTMNAWYNGYAEPREMVRLGYDQISTPDGWLYIVPAAGYYYDFLNVKQLYQNWEPNQIGNVVFPMGHPKIRGGMFAVWNDHVGNGITMKDVHQRAFPALQVLAEKMWTGKTAQSNWSDFTKNSTKIGEGPGLNMRAIVKSTTTDSLVLTNDLLTKTSKSIRLPLKEIGYPYSVAFTLQPAVGSKDDVTLFKSENASVFLLQENGLKLGFTRENYTDLFDFVFSKDKTYKILITGNERGTWLYVDGKLVQKMEDKKVSFPNTRDKISRMQTLVFPLTEIGDTKNGVYGIVSSLKVYNKRLDDQTIEDLK
ncbi:family 20 glycosylhydrolase [Pedobacter boryungensis]|uniref:Family 20 glycosylhydrolase n=1 Tax=Pedobacter boryungensis TaxID=869962 RepID=A0ABX2DAQ6_9SPHI|nr:family 20 glycosylhydrolase [Pedobacter boryungensis]NQX31050.1 family 20 glycosylhydrolase [Pedobacter boryungensis]